MLTSLLLLEHFNFIIGVHNALCSKYIWLPVTWQVYPLVQKLLKTDRQDAHSRSLCYNPILFIKEGK